MHERGGGWHGLVDHTHVASSEHAQLHALDVAIKARIIGAHYLFDGIRGSLQLLNVRAKEALHVLGPGQASASGYALRWDLREHRDIWRCESNYIKSLTIF